jgi:hypothetical protein
MFGSLSRGVLLVWLTVWLSLATIVWGTNYDELNDKHRRPQAHPGEAYL